MIKQLAHLCIYTNDMAATEHFYTEALGLEKGFEMLREGAVFGYYLKLGNNTFIEVFEGEPGALGNINHLSLEVEEMDGVLERVANHGYSIGKKSFGCDHSWQSWLEDPNGVRIELHEYTDDSLQIKGGQCTVNW